MPAAASDRLIMIFPSPCGPRRKSIALRLYFPVLWLLAKCVVLGSTAPAMAVTGASTVNTKLLPSIFVEYATGLIRLSTMRERSSASMAVTLGTAASLTAILFLASPTRVLGKSSDMRAGLGVGKAFGSTGAFAIFIMI